MTLYEQWRPRFAEALDGRLHSIDHLDYLVLGCGIAKVWPGVKAAIVTQINYYTHCSAIEGLVAAGDMEEIVSSLIPAAEAWGKAQGCQFAMISSREGWLRTLRKDGYEPHQVTLCKEL